MFSLRILSFQVLLMLFYVFVNGCTEGQSNPDNSTPAQIRKSVKYRGVSFVSPAKPVSVDAFDSIKNINATWTSIIPFGFVKKDESTVSYNVQWQWWGEKDEGVISLVNHAHSRGIEVMIKPQVWLMGGSFTGDYTVDTEQQWKALEDSYAMYILHFADLADSLNCGAFCLGTEWKNFVAKRPAFWGSLIDSVRSHYDGVITYAGNWDSYQQFPFWDKMDFIGIDAYFPLVDEVTPSVEQCVEGWKKHLPSIEAHQKRVNLPTVLTGCECGRRVLPPRNRET